MTQNEQDRAALADELKSIADKARNYIERGGKDGVSIWSRGLNSIARDLDALRTQHGREEGAVISGKLALANWSKYNGEQADETIYQAEKLATALRECLAALSTNAAQPSAAQQPQRESCVSGIPQGFRAPFYTERRDDDVVAVFDADDGVVFDFNTHTQLSLDDEEGLEAEAKEWLEFANWLVGRMNPAPQTSPDARTPDDVVEAVERMWPLLGTDLTAEEARQAGDASYAWMTDLARAALTASGDARERAIADIADERRRQIEVEGWSPEHDDEHSDGSMAAAAATYAFAAATEDRHLAADPLGFWPWDASWWKPKDARRNLVRAGALIVAEIERRDRRALLDTPTPPTTEKGEGQTNG